MSVARGPEARGFYCPMIVLVVDVFKKAPPGGADSHPIPPASLGIGVSTVQRIEGREGLATTFAHAHCRGLSRRVFSGGRRTLTRRLTPQCLPGASQPHLTGFRTARHSRGRARSSNSSTMGFGPKLTVCLHSPSTNEDGSTRGVRASWCLYGATGALVHTNSVRRPASTKLPIAPQWRHPLQETRHVSFLTQSTNRATLLRSACDGGYTMW